jgi:uncharacterized protein
MKSLGDMTKKLIALKNELHERYAVSKIEVFGSYVRGEQKESSDLDVLVEFDRTVDLLELVSLEMFMSEQLGVKVDVVIKRSIRSELREIILSEAVPL